METKREEHPIVQALRGDDNGWKDSMRVATDIFNEGAFDWVSKVLGHVASNDHAQPQCVELWLAMPIPHGFVEFRILSISAEGIWIDTGAGMLGSPATFLPWTSILSVSVHSEKQLKVASR